jgi:hypothetical protein
MTLGQRDHVFGAIKRAEEKRRESEAFIGFGEQTLGPQETRILQLN